MNWEVEIDEMMQKVSDKARDDEQFRALCESNFSEAIKQATGVNVPAEFFQDNKTIDQVGASDELTDEQLEAVAGGVSGGISMEQLGGVGAIDLQSMDIETALMAVQSQRTQLLDDQLRNQMQEVQGRNAHIADLNNQLADLRNQSPSDDPAVQAQRDADAAAIKSQIDGAGNSQQMDMLRLQSLSNKRNEAFDVMTNFVKKMQDSRSSIIGNMR